MTARARLGCTRRIVFGALGVRTVLIGGLAAFAVLLAALLLDVGLALPHQTRWVLLIAALVAGVIVAGRVARRAWRSRSDEALALWIEAHYPLDYLLVTAVDPRYAGDAEVERLLLGREFEPAATRAAWREVRLPAFAAAVLIAAIVGIPGRRLARVVRPRPGDVLDVARRSGTSRIRPLVARYTAPAYAGGRTTTFEDPTAVAGLEGGVVDIAGRGGASGLLISHEASDLAPSGVGDQWHVSLPMPASPTVIRLRDGADERLLALEPLRDSVPAISLLVPARDTVVRAASGSLRLAADARDDHGLAGGWFEYIISSGSGEVFQFRTGALGRRVLGGPRDSLFATLDLDALVLRPGDVLHLRAVAVDHGPAARGPGFSDTRTLRVARAEESDTASMAIMPPLPGDTAALSERLLIQLAQALESRRPRLSRPTLVEESRSIGRDQATLRKQIADLVFMRLEGTGEAEHARGADANTVPNATPEQLLREAEAATAPDSEERMDFQESETPVVAINRPLLEAYNAMWGASRELDVGEPGRALPSMRTALEAIQRARAAERVYLRGVAAPLVVNVDQVRLSGKREDVSLASRSPGPEGIPERRLDRLLAAASLMVSAPSAARDSLLVLRVDLLTDRPAAASAVGEAIAALRLNRDPSSALATARAALAGSPGTPTSVGTWEKAGW